jgi:hypothetical protein
MPNSTLIKPLNYSLNLSDGMNGLDPSPAALVDYVQACGVADPVGWLDKWIPHWRERCPGANECAEPPE